MNHYLKQAQKQISPKQFRQIHKTCELAVDELKSQEALVIRALQEVDKFKVYRYLGLKSLFQYALALGLSESQACAFITVARKSLECPALQKAIDNKELTVSKAKAVTAVMNSQNQLKWVEAAKTLPRKALEKQLASINPRLVKPESVRFLNDHTLELNVPVKEEVYKKLERIRDLLCQKKQRTVSLEESIEEMAELFLEKHDPLRKAQRAKLREEKKSHSPANAHIAKKSGAIQTDKVLTKLSVNSVLSVHRKIEKKVSINYSSVEKGKEIRVENTITEPSKKSAGLSTLSINKERSSSVVTVCKVARARKTFTEPNENAAHLPGIHGAIDGHEGLARRKKLGAGLIHKIQLRDQGRCQYKAAFNEICGATRWLEFHHIKEVSRGGKDTLENLTTLCSAHHNIMHEK